MHLELTSDYRETVIVLKGRHPQHLMDLQHKAERVGCCQFLVKDAGKTEVKVTWKSQLSLERMMVSVVLSSWLALTGLPDDTLLSRSDLLAWFSVGFHWMAAEPRR